MLCAHVCHGVFAENGFMGMGIGAAMTGLRPIIEGMNMGFLLLAYNQISNNAGMLHYTSGGQYKVHAAALLLEQCRLLCADQTPNEPFSTAAWGQLDCAFSDTQQSSLSACPMRQEVQGLLTGTGDQA